MIALLFVVLISAVIGALIGAAIAYVYYRYPAPIILSPAEERAKEAAKTAFERFKQQERDDLQ